MIGVILVIQPSVLFPGHVSESHDNVQVFENEKPENYMLGAAFSISYAIIHSLINICIAYLKVRISPRDLISCHNGKQLRRRLFVLIFFNENILNSIQLKSIFSLVIMTNLLLYTVQYVKGFGFNPLQSQTFLTSRELKTIENIEN